MWTLLFWPSCYSWRTWQIKKLYPLMEENIIICDLLPQPDNKYKGKEKDDRCYTLIVKIEVKISKKKWVERNKTGWTSFSKDF